MEQILFERPREKIQNYGSQYLTNVELLQVIIGSGSPRAPGGRLARKVHQLIEQHRVSYENLITIHGLGVAKVCQILAAIEIGRRLAIQAPASSTAIWSVLRKIKSFNPGLLYCCWLDGSGMEIDIKMYSLRTSALTDSATKQVLADAIAVSARSIILVMTVRQHNRSPTASELAQALSVKSAAHTLRIRLAGVYAVSRNGNKDWSGEV